MTSKLTREERIQCLYDLKIGQVLNQSDIENIKMLARMALAALDSEPVAWMHNNNNIGIPAITVSPKIGNYWMSEFKDVQPLYRHAQQPVVQCPFPCGWDNLNKLAIQDAAFIACGLVEGEPITEAHRQAAISNNDRLLKVISACRAAMLQAGNSPVIPDRWIPVSERMPENDVSVLTFDGMYKRVHHAMYGHWQCWEPEKITHWMPLPAAPQEVPDGK